MKQSLFKRQTITISALLVVLIGSFIIPQLIVRAAAITVDSATFPGGVDGLCSLDEAILAANTNAPVDGCAGDAAADVITFAGGVTAITVTAPLIMTDAGDILRGAETVTLTAGGAAVNAFIIQADDVIVSGLTIQSFTGAAILVNTAADGVQIGEAIGTGANILINNGNGIIVDTAINTSLRNNIIGFDDEAPQAFGTVCAGTGNTGAGIILQNGADGTIVDDNVLACNGGAGILVTDSDAVQITNNSIGLDSGNSADLGNTGNGITATNADDIAIENNVIDDNQIGISLTNAACTNLLDPTICNVNDNVIGTFAFGTAGNQGDGIFFNNVDGHNVEQNTILDNLGNGISLTNGSDTVDVFNNVIENNVIAININNSDSVDVFRNTIQNNNSHGVFISNGSTDTLFEGGSINNNVGDGISVTGATTTGVWINSSSDPVLIFANGGLGIDLDNDDVPTNAPISNGGMVFPTVTEPAYTDGTTVIGAIDYSGMPGGAHELHFYSSASCDPSNFGEGETYLETINIVFPSAATEYTLTTTPANGDFITIIAVNPATGLSSEFSQCAEVILLSAIFDAIPNPQVVNTAVDFDNLSTTGASISYEWDFGDGSPIDTTFEPSHVYTLANTYTVELCVNGPGTLQVCTTLDVEITDAPTETPTPTNTPTNTPVPDTPVPDTPEPATSVPTIPPIATVTSTLDPTITVTSTLDPTITITSTLISSITPIPSITTTQTLVATLTPLVSTTATVLPTSTGIVTLEPSTATAIALTRISLPPPTLVYFAQSSAPIRQCAARNGLLICVEIDPINPETERVTVTLDDGTVVSAEAIEPYVFKFAQPAQLLPGGILTYTIRVVNPLDVPIRNVRVTDNMPVAITILNSDATSGTLSVDGQRVTFTQASLAANSSITITITGRIREDRVFAANELSNVACLSSSGNAASQCATFGFSPATGIGSGETPLAFWILRQLLIVISGIGGVLLVGFGVRWWLASK